MTSVHYPHCYSVRNPSNQVAINIRLPLPRDLVNNEQHAYFQSLVYSPFFGSNYRFSYRMAFYPSDPGENWNDLHLSDAWADYSDALIVSNNRTGTTVESDGSNSALISVSGPDAAQLYNEHQSGDIFSITLADGATPLPISPSLDIIQSVMPVGITIWDEGKIPFDSADLGHVVWFSLSGYEPLGETWQFEPRMRCYVAPGRVWQKQRDPDQEFDVISEVMTALSASGVCAYPQSVGVEESVVDFASGATVPAHVIEFVLLTDN